MVAQIGATKVGPTCDAHHVVPKIGPTLWPQCGPNIILQILNLMQHSVSVDARYD